MEDKAKAALDLGVGFGTGIVEGIIVKIGAGKAIVTWPTLIGMPLVGAGVALATKGRVSDIFSALGTGAAGVLGYVLPAMVSIKPTTASGAAKELGERKGVKMLPAGPKAAPERAQQQVFNRVGLEF